MKEAGYGNLLPHQARPFGLDLSKGVRSIGRGVPRARHAPWHGAALIKPSSSDHETVPRTYGGGSEAFLTTVGCGGLKCGAADSVAVRMSSGTKRPAVLLLSLLLFASAGPLAGHAAAAESIHLAVDVQHVILAPGGAANVTLTVTNNGSAIDSFDIEVDDAALDSVWEVLALDSEVVNVFPTWAKNASVVVRLNATAVPANGDTVDLVVTEPDSGATSRLTLALSVAHVHAPRIEASGAGDGGLVVLQPGDAVDVSLPVYNDGNVPDTLLLDVDSTPDLAGFWANWSGTGGSSNVSNTTTSSDHSVLMYGNSYTSSNGLDGLLQDLLREDAEGNVSALTGGGMTLANHATKVNTSGDAWNTTLSGTAWDVVVLQDQSQIPGFPRNETLWNASKEAAVGLAERVGDEGAAVMLMMTWGRWDGDNTNAALYPDFSSMNDRLLDGYADFATNMSSAHPGVDVHIAPVGLAFAVVHDAIEDAGDDPLASDSPFTELYAADGSHPSLAGSYLAACTLAASITGANPVGWAAPSGLNASMTLLLQEAAAEAVFNITSGWTYPWTSGVAPTAVTGDDLLAVFNDDVLENVAAYSSVGATLRLEVAPDAVPGDTGLNLFVASTLGNITSVSTLVVRVEAVPDLSIGNIDPSEVLPFGVASTTEVEVVNTGSSAAVWSWSLEDAGGAACVWDVLDASTTFDGPGEAATVGLSVEVPSASTWPQGVQEVCETVLVGTWANDSAVQVTRTIGFVVDERVDLTFGSPEDVSIDVNDGATWQATMMNAGSHPVDVTLSLRAPPSGTPCSGIVSSALTSEATQTVPAGSTRVWNIESSVIATTSCTLLLHATSVHGNEETEVTLGPADHARLTMQGPSDGRLEVEAGSNASLDLTLTPTGTLDLSLSMSTTGLPSGVALLGLPTSPLEMSAADPATTLKVEVVAAATATVGSHTVTFVCSDARGATWSLDFELQISQRRGVDIVPFSGLGQGEVPLEDPEDFFPGSPVVGGREPVPSSVTVVNTGALPSTFVLTAQPVNGTVLGGLSVAFSSNVLTLDAGASSNVAISLEHDGSTLADGHRWQIRILASLSSDETVQDEIVMTVLYRTQQVGLQLSVSTEDVDAGGMVSGSLVLTSRVPDRLTLTASGAACTLPGPFDLHGTSDALSWTCEVPASAEAGFFQFEISVHSALAGASSVPSVRSVVNVTVQSSWTAEHPLHIVVEETMLTLDVDGSTHTVVRVTNTANGPITGTMSLAGRNLAYVQSSWVDMQSNSRSSSFTLEAGQTVRFQLELVSMKSTSGSAEPEVLALYSLAGVQRTDSGGSLTVNIVGPALAPSGMDLGFLSLSNRDSLLLLASGWVLSVLLIGLLRISRGAKRTDDSEQEVPDDVVEKEAPSLGHNEARLENGGRVVCPNCNSTLGVPSGSEPPFRFTCPRCSSGIRVVE